MTDTNRDTDDLRADRKGQARIDYVDNGLIRIGIDGANGAIRRVLNTARGEPVELIATRSAATPWRIQVYPTDVESLWVTAQGATFSYVRNADGSLALTWEKPPYTVTATIAAPPDALDARITCAVRNVGPDPLSLLEYPVLGGIGRLTVEAGEAGDDYLAHPHATGYLFKNPYTLFDAGDPAHNGIEHSPTMEGYNGMPMQWMAYYADGGPGFYVAAQDGACHQKCLDFFKDAPTSLMARVRHACPAIHDGNGYDVPYPVVIGALTEGTWYEAADRYRAWALAQSWVQRGTLLDRKKRGDIATWLLEDVGLSTFSINAMYDRSPWITYLRAVIGAPVFHVLAVNWQQGGADYFGSTQPAGRDAAFPHRFHPRTLAAIRANGDRFASMTFTTLYLKRDDGVDAIEGNAVQQVFPPANIVSRENYNNTNGDPTDFQFMCPAPSLMSELTTWRDSALVARAGIDASYYDIGPNNNLKICLARDHGHPVGGGPQLMSASRDLLARTKAHCIKAKGGYVPLGTEVITEETVAELDFYQARGEASPVTDYESHWFRPWIKTLDCEKIPAFAYVYHDYGPLRLDGWGGLAKEQGELFYWVAARVYLWGGLFELNYEFASMESVSDPDDPTVQWHDDVSQSFYPIFHERPYAPAPAKEAFLRKMAAARTGFANPYLAYGRMRPPAMPHTAAPIALDWLQYNMGPDTDEVRDGLSAMTVPGVVCSAYTYDDRQAGFLYVNLHPGVLRDVQVSLDPGRRGLAHIPNLHVYEVTAEEVRDLGPIAAPTAYTVALPSREVLLLEIR